MGAECTDQAGFPCKPEAQARGIRVLLPQGPAAFPCLRCGLGWKGSRDERGAGMKGEPGSAKVEETRRMSDLLCVPFQPG